MKVGRKRKSESKQKVTLVHIDSSESEIEYEGSKKKKLKSRDSVSSKKSNNSVIKKNSQHNQNKKMQTPNTLLKQMVPSFQELAYRSRRSENIEELSEFSFEFLCTKCGIDLEMLIDEKKIVTCHPLLGVLMCPECCEYYGDGDFSLDSDDEDKYCRWCGEGGTIFACSKCICGFCHKCINSHFGREAVKKVQKEDDWLCYFCNPKPLWNLRYICSLAKKKASKKKALNKKEKTFSSNLTLKKKLDKTSKRKNKNKNKNANKSPTKSYSESSSKDECEAETKSDQSNSESEAETKSDQSESESEAETKSNQDKNKETKKNNLAAQVKEEKFNNLKYLDSGSDSNDETNIQEKKSKKNSQTGEKETESKSDEVEVEKMEKKENEEELGGKYIKFEQISERLKNILKLIENQLSFGKYWSTNKLKQLKDKRHLRKPKRLQKECRKVKWFTSLLASHFMGFVNSVALLENELNEKENESQEKQKEEDDVEEKEKTSSSPSRPSSTYGIILNFIDFMQNQVNTFDRKGIDFEDLINSEMYENKNVLGLDKKKWKKTETQIETETETGEKKPESEPASDILSENPNEEKESNELSECSYEKGEKSPDTLNLTPFQDDEIENIVTILNAD